jgi:predicted 3-demethylubiquinone-9 3-methyltransferase (glyoxalase superfamily)
LYVINKIIHRIIGDFMQNITPCLWFDSNAEEAVKFYTSVFKDSEILDAMYYGESGPGTKGSLLSMTFRLRGQEFMVLNGGPHFSFTPAVSFFIACKNQEEVDYFWHKLSEGGSEERCGWVTDRFGVSWQVVPEVLGKMLNDKDKERANRVMEVMLQMNKLDIKALQDAYEKSVV